MSIPPYDQNGNLPPGIHASTLVEIEARYGVPGMVRRARTENLKDFVGHIDAYAIGVYINGSYITKKRAPNDIDIALVLPNGFNPSSPTGRRIRAYQKMKDRYRLHIFAYELSEDDVGLRNMISDWRQDRDGNPKGIVYVEFTQ